MDADLAEEARILPPGSPVVWRSGTLCFRGLYLGDGWWISDFVFHNPDLHRVIAHGIVGGKARIL
mgnify:FL=1